MNATTAGGTSGDELSVVESELKQIDNAFTAGRMNAFGTQQTSDEIIREMRNVSLMQTQIFFKTAARIKSSGDEETAFEKALSQSHSDVSEKSFEEITKIFKQKELALRSIGDNLKQMARSVQNVNDTVQKLPK